MDIDLKLLGPYAKVYLEGFKATAKTNEPLTKPNRANFGALHKKQNVRFLQDVDSKRNDKRSQMEESRKARRSMKFMNARKSNMAEIAQETSKDLSDKTDDDSIEISAIESMDTSGTSEVTANSKSKLVPGNPVKPSAITTNNKVAAATKLGQNRSNLNVVNNRNLKPVPNNKLPFSQTVSQKDETRREQLLKWKKEKEAADMASRKTQKQPFKVGVILGTKPINGSDTSTANNTTNKNSKNLLSGSTTSVPSRNGGVAAPRVPPVTTSRKPMTAGTTASDIPAGDARRITRAMSKVTTNTGITAVKSTTQVMKPAVDKMKTLSIADKGTTSRPVTASSTVSKSGPSSQPTKPSQTSSSSKKPLDPVPNKKPIAAQGRTINGVKGNKPVPKGVSESVSKTQSTTTTTPNDNEKNVPVAASTEQKPVEVKPKKKLKPQAIDATYINYNSQFSNACLTLKSYSTEWTAILEQLEQQKEEMQEEILGDIHSALGKVKLLLQSKLPQFGELLYSYLCQETDPRPILPCDLEGWWDVAAIQLEAIDKEFKGLQALRQNKWLKVLPVSAPQEINHGNNEKEANKPTALIRRAKPNPVKTQASAALRAFLANQRRMATNVGKSDNNETEEAMDVALPLKEEAVQQENNLEQDLNTSGRTFDGRFFTISSPMAKNTPEARTPQRIKDGMSARSNRSPATSLLRTPSRRLSTTSDSSLKRMSFCILGVRQSMGSFNKIGAVPISADEKNQETENEEMF